MKGLERGADLDFSFPRFLLEPLKVAIAFQTYHKLRRFPFVQLNAIAAQAKAAKEHLA